MKHFVYLALALLVLAACTPTDSAETTPQTITCPDGTEVAAGEECPQEETPEETEEELEEPQEPETNLQDIRFDESAFSQVFGGSDQPTPAVNANLQDIQARALQQTLNGYTYLVYERGDDITRPPTYQGAQIYVREGELAIHYGTTVELQGGKYDHIINGLGYCEDCRETPEPTEIETPSIPSPLDSILALEDATSAQSAQSIDGRRTIRLEATLDGQEVEVYVDQFSGLPLEIRYGGRTTQFRSLSMNARDDAFAPPY